MRMCWSPGKLFLIPLVATASRKGPFCEKAQAFAHCQLSTIQLLALFTLISLPCLLGYLCKRKENFIFIYSSNKELKNSCMAKTTQHCKAIILQLNTHTRVVSACFVPGLVLSHSNHYQSQA